MLLKPYAFTSGPPVHKPVWFPRLNTFLYYLHPNYTANKAIDLSAY
jgi:hypothetical protein